MTRGATTTTLAATLALAATVGLALPASAASDRSGAARTSEHSSGANAKWMHRAQNRAYRSGYDRGFRDGRLADRYVAPAGGYAKAPGDGDIMPDSDRVVTGRSAYVDPNYRAPDNPRLLDNGGVLGTGVLGGDGVLGTGILDGRGALGIGVLGF